MRSLVSTDKARPRVESWEAPAGTGPRLCRNTTATYRFSSAKLSLRWRHPGDNRHGQFQPNAHPNSGVPAGIIKPWTWILSLRRAAGRYAARSAPGHGFEHEPADGAERASQRIAQTAATFTPTRTMHPDQIWSPRSSEIHGHRPWRPGSQADHQEPTHAEQAAHVDAGRTVRAALRPGV